MRYTLSTTLDANPDTVWSAIHSIDTVRKVARGMMDFRLLGKGPLPDRWRAGDTVRIRMLLFHLIPTWKHTIALESLDEKRREMQTREWGGLLRKWDHRIQVEPAGDGRSRYTDEVDVAAGPLTPLAWLMAAAFFHYRQARWRRLARRL